MVTTGSFGRLRLFASGESISANAGLTAFASVVQGTKLYQVTPNNSYFDPLIEVVDRAASEAMIDLFGKHSGSGIIGFRFGAGGGKYHYGWANATWEGTVVAFKLELGVPTWSTADGILAGTQTEVPEPAGIAAGLGALALGAAGLRRWRQRKQAA